jgi:hypothetical protein
MFYLGTFSTFFLGGTSNHLFLLLFVLSFCVNGYWRTTSLVKITSIVEKPIFPLD